MTGIMKLVRWPVRQIIRHIPGLTPEYGTMLLNHIAMSLKSRYLGTYFGLFWTVLNPLLWTGIYTFMIAFVFRARLNLDSTPLDYAIFVLCGMVPWLALQESVMIATSSIVGNSNIVKNVLFPLEVLPLGAVLAGLASQLVGLGLVMVFILLSGRPLGLPLIFLPLALILQIVLALGLGYFLAALNVFVRDTAYFLTYIFMVVLFLSPVMYDISMMPGPAQAISALNPVHYFVLMYRAVFFNNAWPPLAGTIYLAVVAGLVLWGGYAFFRRTRPYFADYLA